MISFYDLKLIEQLSKPRMSFENIKKVIIKKCLDGGYATNKKELLMKTGWEIEVKE